MIGSFASGAIAFIVAKNQTKTLYQLFKELQGYLEPKFELKIVKHLAQSIESEMMDGF